MSNNKKKPAKAQDNPFVIVNNVELKGNRTPNPYTEKLTESIMKLKPKDRMQSVFIPLSIAKTQKDANNLILAAKRAAKDKHDDYSFSAKFSFENDDKDGGKYLGANVWRLN